MIKRVFALVNAMSITPRISINGADVPEAAGQRTGPTRGSGRPRGRADPGVGAQPDC